MKRALLLACLVVIVGYLWLKNESPKQTPEPILQEVKDKKVRLGIKISVRSLLEEWKSRKLTYKGRNTSKIVPEHELAEIRKSLFSEGIHSERAFVATVTQALLELGVAQGEVGEIANDLINLRSEENSNLSGKRSQSSARSLNSSP